MRHEIAGDPVVGVVEQDSHQSPICRSNLNDGVSVNSNEKPEVEVG